MFTACKVYFLECFVKREGRKNLYTDEQTILKPNLWKNSLQVPKIEGVNFKTKVKKELLSVFRSKNSFFF